MIRYLAPKLGSDAQKILLGIMFITGILSMMMSNTATTAMIIAMLAPLLSVDGNIKQLHKPLLIGVAHISKIDIFVCL